MTLRYDNERKQVAHTALQLLETGLVANTSGNASVRLGDHVAITPSSRPYDCLQPHDIVVVDLEGRILDGDLLPSSETPLHLSIYAADAAIGAIVHTHSVYATAVSTLVKELPAIHYQVADLGGPVPVAPYFTFGTPELAAAVTGALRGRTAALMQNHGAVTVGDTLEQALARAITLEWLSRVFLIADQAGSPTLIDDGELERVADRLGEFASQQAARVRNR